MRQSTEQTNGKRHALLRFTRRRFLGTSLAVGGAAGLIAPSVGWPRLVPEAEAQSNRGDHGFYHGICYQAFPAPYNPSIANSTCIFFGSDIAYDPMAPLWGTGYTSRSGIQYPGRNDLQTLKDMGVNLVRLYDWEPRNNHLNFLNYCSQLGIKVLAPVSNYFLQPGGGFNQRETLIPALIRSFSNGAGTDYHPAIAGIIMANEPALNGITVSQCITFTQDWVRLEQQQVPGFSRPYIGHPVDFGKRNGEPYPAWSFWTALLGGLRDTTIRDLPSRLFLAPQPQNDATYLFDNAEGSNHGYVPLTYAQFQKPLLFTELGQDRTKPNYLTVIDGQLSRSIAYGMAYPNQLLGVCHFQFDDKVWLCPTGGACPSEGSFGVFSHSNTVLFTVTYVDTDFTHYDGVPCGGSQLRPDALTRNPVYDVVVKNYASSRSRGRGPNSR